MLQLSGWLLAGALLLPIIGAVVARLVSRSWGQRTARIIGGGAMAAAIGCLLALQWLPLEVATLGRLAIFLPSQAVVVPQDSIIELPTAVLVAEAEPTNTTRPTATSAPTPTQEPTATVEPTFTPTPPPTEAPPPPTEAPPPPTEAPPSPTEAPRQVQRYVVESGDTLKSIANRFDISVEAILRFNGLSEEDGDNLRVGQELFIPPQ